MFIESPLEQIEFGTFRPYWFGLIFEHPCFHSIMGVFLVLELSESLLWECLKYHASMSIHI